MARRFISGQRVRKLPTVELNDAINAARDRELFGNRGGTGGSNGQFLISVRNDTDDDDFDRYQAVGLEDALILPGDNEVGFVDGINLSAIVPTFEHVSRFAITQEPIAAGQMGRALLYGVTVARVDIRSLQHRFCQPTDGILTLGSVDFGGARIIWPTAPVSLGEQWCVVLLTGNGQATTGERISGELETPLPGATKPDGSSREPGTAVLRVWTTDPDNTLETQTHNRYAISGVTPTDPDDLDAGQSFEIDIDVRFRLIPNHPIYVVESTSRNGTYKVESIEWDAVAGKTTITTTNAIPIVLDDDDEPVVDGTILIPGGDRRKESDRYEIVLNYSTQPANIHAWVSAIHDGAAYVVGNMDY